MTSFFHFYNFIECLVCARHCATLQLYFIIYKTGRNNTYLIVIDCKNGHKFPSCFYMILQCELAASPIKR